MSVADPGDESAEDRPTELDRDDRPSISATGATEGRTVVMVHGTLDRSAGLAKLARRLGATFRVVRFDRRGYGRSRHIAGPYSVAANVADLVSIIDEIDRPVALFGHSFGGNICLAAAQARPAAVCGIAVYESPLSWRPEWFETSGYTEPTEWSEDPGLAAERFMRRLIGDAIWERLPQQTRLDRRAEGLTMVDELSDLRSGPAPWSADKIATPVLALYGNRGLSHHRRAMEIVAAEMANGSIIEVDDANHFGPNMRPDRVAAAVASFFTAAFDAVEPRSGPI